MSKLSELIKDQRKLLGVSQTYIAYILDVSEQYVSNFERNKSYMAYKYLPLLSKKLNLSMKTIEEAVAQDEIDKVRAMFNSEFNDINEYFGELQK